jgi:hypothetical protein
MKKAMESASSKLDEKINELGDWRGKTLAKVREIVHEADPEIVEEWKWVKPTSPGTPVFSHGGIVCTGETYKNVVKMTFAKGAAVQDPSGLFNSSLEGNVRRAIDIHEGDKLDEAALKDLIRAAVALNHPTKPLRLRSGQAPAGFAGTPANHPNESPSTSSGQAPSATLRAGSGGTRRGPWAGKSKLRPRRASSKRAD